MATRLRKLNLKEISLVKRGANPGARIVLLKSMEDDNSMNPLTRFLKSMREALVAVAPEQEEAIDKSLSEAAQALSEPMPDELGKSNAGKVNAKRGLAAKPGGDNGEPLGAEGGEQEGATTDDDEGNSPKKGLAKMMKTAEGATPDQVAQINKAEQEIIRVTKIAEEAVAKAAALEARETERLNIAKASDVLGDVPGATPVEFAKVWAKLDDAEKEVLEKVMKAANAAVETALTIELGSAIGRPASVSEKLDHVAKELIKQFPNLTMPQAITKAMEIDPSLYPESAPVAAARH
jgi:hypothetical protein